jgi:LmbE family N-acetylglucosaminyl deacetylase
LLRREDHSHRNNDEKGDFMKFHLNTSEVFVPDEVLEKEALARTTHLCLAAHQDDIEIMAAGPIVECFQRDDKWFTGVVVTDGRGSPRSGIYEKYSDEEMRLVRFKEQRKAAIVGEFAAQIMLDIPSKVMKDASRNEPVDDILEILHATRPKIVYTHNLADKHDTHVAVALRVIEALRRLDQTERPERVVGCEVWRALDWMVDSDKFLMDVSDHENLQLALLGVFDSQIAGGKRYDLASMGRRRANATYFESHGVDETLGLSYAMDMTPLMNDADKAPEAFVKEFVQRFSQDIADRLQRLG